MNKSKFVDRFNSQNTLCYVEPSHVLRECVVLDKHGHEIATRKELHDEVQILGILKRVK